MAAPCPLLGDGITNDTLFHIAHFLPSARDLLCLQLTCPRFAAKCIAAPDDDAGGAAAAPEMMCIPEEEARLWVARCSERERGWVPRCERESWLGLMHEVGLLRLPLVFGRAHAHNTLSEDAGAGGAAAAGLRHLEQLAVLHARCMALGASSAQLGQCLADADTPVALLALQQSVASGAAGAAPEMPSIPEASRARHAEFAPGPENCDQGWRRSANARSRPRRRRSGW